MKALYYVFVIFCIFGIVSCKGKKITTTVPSGPAAIPAKVAVSTGPVQGLAVNKALPAPVIAEKKDAQERVTMRENPFVPLLGRGGSQETVVKEEVDLPDTVKLNQLELKGILRDSNELSGLFKHLQSGKVYLTRKGKLRDRRNKIMKDVIVITVDADKVILKRHNQQQEYVLKRERNDN